MSLAAYSNNSLDPDKHNARWWRDTMGNMRMYLRAINKIPCGAQIYAAYEVKYKCSDKFSFHVHLKAIKVHTIDIVTTTEEFDSDWSKVQDYRRLLKALGILTEDKRSSTKRPRTTKGNEC